MATPLNDTSLKAVYVQCQSKPSIRRYILQNEATVVAAAEAIKQFLLDNPNLIGVFPGGLETCLQNGSQVTKYLVLKKNIVCLSIEPQAPPSSRTELQDVFTEALLNRPIKCSQGHFLEEHLAKEWVNKKGNICPIGPHQIGDLVVDEDCAFEADRFRKDHEGERTAHATMHTTIESLKKVNQENQRNFNALGEENRENQRKLIVSSGKNLHHPVPDTATLVEIVSIGAHIATAAKVIKLLAKEGTKASLIKASGKAVPIVGSLLCAGYGVYRICHGETLHGVLEIASGAVTWIPVVGPAISIGMDISLMGFDIKKQNAMVDEAREVLKLGTIPHPTKEQVDTAFRTQIKIAHPDNIKELSQTHQQLCEDAAKIVIAARNLLYKTNNWSK